MATAELTAQRLRELLHYDPQTGVFTWKMNRGGTAWAGTCAGVLSKGRYKISVDGRKYVAARLAWLYMHGVWPAGVIDHINGIPSQNAAVNLRDVTQTVNMQNIHKHNSQDTQSGLRGVYRERIEVRWFAAIGVNSKQIYLGRFDTAEEAHAAYLAAKRRLHPGCTI